MSTEKEANVFELAALGIEPIPLEPLPVLL